MDMEEEMSWMKRDLVFLIIQFLDEKKYEETVHKLEKESGYFFNKRYFEECITNGEWDDAEKYLSGYTKLEDNRYSRDIFFMIRKQKYLEALEKGDRGRAVEILMTELKVFSTYDEELFKETTLLSTLPDFRDTEQLSNYVDAKLARVTMCADLKKLVEGNPLLCDKLQSPTLKNSRLRKLINQSLNWQHKFCKNPRPKPDIKTLFLDHSCGPPNDGCAPSPVTNTLMGPLRGFYTPPVVRRLGDPFSAARPAPLPFIHPFHPAAAPAPLAASLARRMADPFHVAHQALPAGPIGLSAISNTASTAKRPRTPANNLSTDYQTAKSENVLKRPRPSGVSKESGDSCTLPDVEPRVTDEMERSKIWKLTEMNEPSQFRSLHLPDSLMPKRAVRMIYTNTGGAILALTVNGVHKLWKWEKNEHNLTGKATSALPPQLWKPRSGILMTNVIQEKENAVPVKKRKENAVPCFALSKNDSYLMSASGGKISLFSVMTFKTITTFMAPPPAATSLAFHPLDNNFIAIGMDDSSIQIYSVPADEVKIKLRGHKKRVTGLAFSDVLNILVSSGSDAKLCVWSMDGWKMQAFKFLNIPRTRVIDYIEQTHVHFHQDQIHVLAVHASHMAIYEAPKLEILKQWIPVETSGIIRHAVFSCDSKSIYACFEDGSVGILTTATLQLRCRINAAAYLPEIANHFCAFPLQLAAHPSDPDQFVVALTNGGVHVMKPPVDGKWGENVSEPSISSKA